MADIAPAVRILPAGAPLDKEAVYPMGPIILADLPAEHLNRAAAGAEQKALAHRLFRVHAVHIDQAAPALLPEPVPESLRHAPGRKRPLIPGRGKLILPRRLQGAPEQRRRRMNHAVQFAAGLRKTPQRFLLPEADLRRNSQHLIAPLRQVLPGFPHLHGPQIRDHDPFHRPQLHVLS